MNTDSPDAIKQIYEPMTKRLASLETAERRELAKKVGASEASLRFIANGQTKYCGFNLAVSLHQALFPHLMIVTQLAEGSSEKAA